MALTVERIPLPTSSPGTARTLTALRFGPPGARPKAYLQAALHADEPPGMLILHHLARLLNAADARGEIRGEIVLVPAANPIGLDQVVQGAVLGRHDLRSAANYNRQWPNLASGLVERVADRLGPDADANVAVIRAALAARIAEIADAPAGPVDGVAALHLAIHRLAHDADFAADLHCDDEAEAYLMTLEEPLDWAVTLAADTGVRWVMPGPEHDGTYFTGSLIHPWRVAAAAAPAGCPVPLGCYAATFEMRGAGVIDDRLAAADAAGLYRHLQRLGAVAGEPGTPDAAAVAVVPASQLISTPVAGLVVYPAPLGGKVGRGELVAEVVDPAAADPDAARTGLYAGIAGHVISRRHQRIVGPGDFVAMIVAPDS